MTGTGSDEHWSIGCVQLTKSELDLKALICSFLKQNKPVRCIKAVAKSTV